MLMYLHPDEIVELFEEAVRVSCVGVIRITEDDVRDPANIWFDAVSTLTPDDFQAALEKAGCRNVALVAPDETRWQTNVLIQTYHGDPPKVFHMEADA